MHMHTSQPHITCTHSPPNQLEASRQRLAAFETAFQTYNLDPPPHLNMDTHTNACTLATVRDRGLGEVLGRTSPGRHTPDSAGSNPQLGVRGNILGLFMP